MGMANIVLNGPANPTTRYEGQATFFFYKAASAGVTNTQVDVYIDTGLVARMDVTEHFKVARPSNSMRFVPVDPNNRAVFIACDTDEEYGTSAVAGTVQVSNFPPSFDIDNFPTLYTTTPKNESLDNDRYISKLSIGTGATAGDTFYLVNPIGSGKTVSVDSISIDHIVNATGVKEPCSFLIQRWTFSAITPSLFKWEGRNAGLHGSNGLAFMDRASAAGFAVTVGGNDDLITKFIDGNYESDLKAPIILAPGRLLQMSITKQTAATSTTLLVAAQYSEFV